MTNSTATVRLTAGAMKLLFLLICGAGTVAAQEKNGTANTLSDAEKRAGWTLLFDGKTLDGWRGFKKADATDSRWKAVDGTLAVVKDNGRDTHGERDIVTRDTYEQFELVWDWKIEPGGNSGLKYFVLEDRDSAIGHEYQLIDDTRHADAKIGPQRQTAAFYDVLPASDRPMKPAGEWNTSRIVVRGQTAEHWLNGKKVLQYELNSPALNAAIEKSKFKGMERFGKRQNGHILLQDHGNQVWFRNIKIRRLA